MASIASQVILHPSLSKSLKIGQTALGRDKAYRGIQYFARFYVWYLLSRGEKDASLPWNSLKSHLAVARKLLRLGKPLENLQAAFRLSTTPGPSIMEDATQIAKQLAYFGFLGLDGIVWAQTIKFLNLKSEIASRVARVSNRFWLAGIILSIVNSICKSLRLSKQEKKLRFSQRYQLKDAGEGAELEAKIRSVNAERGATRHQLITDMLDAWIPATALGYANLNDGIIGIFGVITSIMALQKQWNGLSK